jgi:glycosyltransferase involved in cell wall biosynthesis
MGKKVYWFGEKLFHNVGVKSFIKRILLAPMFFLSDAIFAIGGEAITSYKNHGYNKDICKVHYAINNEKFLRSNNLAFKNELKNNGKFIFLTSSSLINRKGIDLAISAYLALDDHQRTLAELWIIGDGPEKQNLMNLAKNDQGVKFFGFIQPDFVSKYFALATAFIFPTRYDGWGVVLNEAIAFGLPVIVSDAAVSSELICNGINGYVCKSDCLHDYITAMRILLNDPNIVHAMRIKNIDISLNIDSSVVANKIFSKIACDIEYDHHSLA